MVTMSISLPEDLKSRLDKHDDINWSAVARKALEERLALEDDRKKFEAIVKNSKLTAKDAKLIGEKINSAVSKRFRAYAKQAGY